MKEFLKNISIYGILPVIGKFIGFFLIPIYSRVFSTTEYGTIELVVTLISFLAYGCNLCLQSSVGRFFYERKTIDGKKILVSTGLWITIAFTLMILLLSYGNRAYILNSYLNGFGNESILLVGFVWLFFSALSNYLCILPRYDKRPKIYVICSVIALFVRVGSTILYVLYFKLGILSVLLGHISGALISALLMGWVSRNYLSWQFSIRDLKLLLKFALPLLPGVLIIALWQPLLRTLIGDYFSVSVVGLFSFALSLSSMMLMVSSAIDMAWKPMLFENYKSETFKNEITQIAQKSAFLLYSLTFAITFLSPELCLYIGSSVYQESSVFIGFLCLSYSLNILILLRGFAPLILKKTYLSAAMEFCSVVIGFVAFMVIQDRWGMLGIGIAVIIPQLVKYLLMVGYTRRTMNIKTENRKEIVFLLLVLISICMVISNSLLIYRLISLLISLCISFFLLKSMIWKVFTALLFLRRNR